MKNETIAAEIYKCVAPSSNIVSIANCMTRLRLQLLVKEDNLEEKLKKIDGVLGVHDTDEELQIILGPGKAAAVTEIFKKLAVQDSKMQIGNAEAVHEKIRAKNATPIKLLFKRIASVFIPLIPGFIACGLLTGVLAACAKIEPSMANAAWWKLLATAGNAVFFGMNLFVGYNASKVFGGTPIIGGLLGAFLAHPGLSSVVIYDTPLVPGRGGVIAVLLAAVFAVYVEKRLHKIVPEMFDLFVTPFLTVLVTVCAATFVLQPVGGFISETIGSATLAAIDQGKAATGFILGLIWLPLVMFGVHQSFTPIHVDLLTRYGVTVLLPILAMAGAGQVGASAAVYFKTKNKLLKKTVLSALPVGIMGVGEPLIYGVTFPLGKPFIAACIGGAFGGAVQANFAVGARAMGISGLLLTPTTDNALMYLAGVLTAYVTGFAAAWIIGFDDPPENDDN